MSSDYKYRQGYNNLYLKNIKITKYDKLVSIVCSLGFIYQIIVILTKVHNDNEFVKMHLNSGACYQLIQLFMVAICFTGCAIFTSLSWLFNTVAVLSLVLYYMFMFMNMISAVRGTKPCRLFISNIQLIY